MKKVLSLFVIGSVLATVSFGVNASYNEISCSSDSVFSENSCTQCFEGGKISEGKDLGLLTDIWNNKTSKTMYFLKEENSLDEAVKMIPLNGSSWSYEPSTSGFWRYTDSLEALPNNGGFYELAPGKSVDWIQSKLGYSLKLNKSAGEGENVGLLKYVINVHIDDNGVPSEDSTSHSECVLFKAAGGTTSNVPSQPEEPKQPLPKTGPQEVFLLLVSLLLAGFVFSFSRKKQS